MMKYFMLTIDTEGDNDGKFYRTPGNLNIPYKHKFLELCENYSIPITCFVTYNVISSNEFFDLMESWKNSKLIEIGTHLHSWETPPFEDNSTIEYESKFTFEKNYPIDVIKSKIQHIKDKTIELYGIKPISYRAGRFGFELKSGLKYLHELGYKYSSSITPGLSWKNINGPDHRTYDYNALYSYKNVIEVPLTLHPKFNINFIKHLPMSSLFNAALNKIGLGLLWLRPTHTSVKNMEYVISNRQFSMSMLHSNELLAGVNPYLKSNEKVKKFTQNFEKLFTYINDNNICPLLIKDISKYKENIPIIELD